GDARRSPSESRYSRGLVYFLFSATRRSCRSNPSRFAREAMARHETMEAFVAARDNYLKVLSVLLPVGALGMSILLGSTGAEAAREIALDPPAGGTAAPRVAERLAAIRDAVSAVTVPGAETAP